MDEWIKKLVNNKMIKPMYKSMIKRMVNEQIN